MVSPCPHRRRYNQCACARPDPSPGRAQPRGAHPASADLSVAGNISKRVLMANIFRYLLADRNRFAVLRRKKCFAACLFRQAAKNALILVRVIFVEDADRVNDGVRFFCFIQYHRQCLFAGIVAAIADDEEDFLVALPGVQLIERHIHRVIKGCLACNRSRLDGSFHLIHTMSEGNLGG